MSSLVQAAALHVEPLSDRYRDEFARLLDEDPVVNSVLASRLRAAGTIEPRRFGGPILGVRDPAGRLTGAAYHGGNLLPVGGGPAEWDALAEHLRTCPRICTAISGRARAVDALWQALSPAWGRPRAVRGVQPLLVLDRPRRPPAGDPRVRQIRPDEIERYLPAAAAMFTEELGASPYSGAHGHGFRRRVAGLLREGRAFGIVDELGAMAFKADIGAVSGFTCQVQGVWVRPELRGLGLGTRALAEVFRRALDLAPTVSLYVNDFNLPARRVYARLGMREIATLSTALF